MEYFTVEDLEVFLLIVVRMSAFIFAAPFFSMQNIPVRVKSAISLAISFILFQVLGEPTLEYEGIVGYTGLIIQELLVGLLIGYMANICSTIINFAGQLIDMEIGFSMANVLDPVSNIQTTVTGNFYSYFVMLLLILTDMHHVLLKAFVDAYKVIGIGEAIFRPNLFEVMLLYMVDYFVIGFRIVLPIFAATLLINIVLGVLAKVAPQMNMFVIGMPLKVLVGLIILFFVIGSMDSVAEFIFGEMEKMVSTIIENLQ